MPKDLIIIQVEDNIYVAFSNKLSHQRNPHIYTLQTSARFKWHLAFCFLLFKYVGPRIIMQLLPPPWPSQWLWSVCAPGPASPCSRGSRSRAWAGECHQSQSLPGAAQPLVNCFVCLSKVQYPWDRNHCSWRGGAVPWLYMVTGGVWAQLPALLSRGSLAPAPLSACWRRGASAAAHHTPSTPHPHGITAKE